MFLFDKNTHVLNIKFENFVQNIEFSDGLPLFRLSVEFNDTGLPDLVLEPKDLEITDYVSDGNRLLLCYRIEVPQGNGSLGVSIRLIHSGEEVTGSISAEVSGDMLLRRVQFPYMENREVYHFDNLLMSSPWGDNINRPIETIQQYCAGKDSSWIYDYVKCGENEVIYSYPSIMSMQYMVLHNKARAFYLGCYSTGASTMTFNAKALGRSALGLSINHFPFLKNGKWQSPECGISLLKGDWHSAADLYASHMRDKFNSPDNPAWMRAGTTGWNGFVQIFMRKEGEEPTFRYQDLPSVYKRIQETGMDTLHVAGWNYNGFDTYYPDYDIDPLLGSEEELRNAIKKINAMGGRVILYTNGRLIDPNSGFYKKGGDECVCIGKDGNPYIERYNTSADFRVACPACDEYGTYLSIQTRKIAEDFGANAIQIDQISCNHADFCYDTTHSHPTPASNFLTGVDKELKQIRRTHKEINPEFFTWCEGCHERFGQYYDVNQGHGEGPTWQLGESIPEQFSYTYPDRWVTGESSDIQQLCHTFVQGKPFDLPISSVDSEEYVRLLKDFIKIRRAYPQYFYRGVFIDNVGFDVNNGIRVFGIRKQKGKGLLVNLWKQGAEDWMECSALLRIPCFDMKCKAVYPEINHVTKGMDILKVIWKGPVATLVFE
jgi:hypothetical protein